MKKRPPIVVILGSVDHGKTTLLDYIRKTNIADREAGGITQSIGSYEIEHNGEKITFIDTPGHAAFTKMRARGCYCADIGILMIAADDGIKPQTEESIKILRESKIPFIVAINKIDTPGANVEKIKNELIQKNVLLENYGGDVSFQEISAKTGKGVSDLLDLILLAAEVEELEYKPDGPVTGFILESKLDQRRGIIATAIITNGTLRKGETIGAGAAGGRVKALTDFLGRRIDSATASSPVQILGFESLPQIGDRLAPERISVSKEREKTDSLPLKDEPAVKIILRADVAGSLEALSETIQGLVQTLFESKDDYPKIYIIDEAVGDITDGDVKLAISTGALIVGFKTKTTKAAENLARGQKVRIINSGVIYDLIKTLEEDLEKLKQRAVAGKLEIMAIFGKKDGQQIIGGKISEGMIRNQTVLDIRRGDNIIGTGKIINLQQGKENAQTVESGKECGLLFDSKNNIKVGDVLIAH